MIYTALLDPEKKMWVKIIQDRRFIQHWGPQWRCGQHSCNRTYSAFRMPPKIHPYVQCYLLMTPPYTEDHSPISMILKWWLVDSRIPRKANQSASVWEKQIHRRHTPHIFQTFTFIPHLHVWSFRLLPFTWSKTGLDLCGEHFMSNFRLFVKNWLEFWSDVVFEKRRS
jgi:hypothetical protein